MGKYNLFIIRKRRQAGRGKKEKEKMRDKDGEGCKRKDTEEWGEICLNKRGRV